MNVMNAFGQRQHPEKFVPLVIRKALAGELVTIHTHTAAHPHESGVGSAGVRAGEGGGAAGQIPGSRFYIHARNIAAAVLFLLERGQVGEKCVRC
jgi:dTDP-glucose 4,6-dehydratase